MKLAKKLISRAKEAGASCVKFQSWTKDSIFTKQKYKENYFLNDDYRNRNDYTLEEIVDEYSISGDQLVEMSEYAKDLEIHCSSTPFTKMEVDHLVDVLQVPFLKVASMDLNNYPFLEYIGSKGKPVVLSTGFSQLFEIDKAVKTIERFHSEIAILHCVSSYPPKDNDINLLNITTLRNIYPDYLIGFSDHSLGIPMPLASIALGAKIIEKHFTLDKNMEGWDHKVSADYSELKSIVSDSNRIHEALGSLKITVSEDEERKNEFRRSIISAKPIKKGEKITHEHIDYKRPGGNIDPEYTQFIIGRITSRDLGEDEVIKLTDIL
jgi:N-acetylneuraminate synthase